MARMTLAYNAERTDVLCAQMSGLMRRQSLQHFQAPPDEIRANRKAERHFPPALCNQTCGLVPPAGEIGKPAQV